MSYNIREFGGEMSTIDRAEKIVIVFKSDSQVNFGFIDSADDRVRKDGLGTSEPMKIYLEGEYFVKRVKHDKKTGLHTVTLTLERPV
jgi:hypothetical protein